MALKLCYALDGTIKELTRVLSASSVSEMHFSMRKMKMTTRRYTMGETSFSLTSEIRSMVMTRLLKKLQEHYVFPKIAQTIEIDLQRRLSEGEYDEITEAVVFCEVVTEQMYEISQDRHLCIFYHPEAQPVYEDTNLYNDPQWQANERQRALLQNFGFQKIERLLGNVGYLDLRYFYHPEFAGDVAIAAMNFLSQTSALIIDLRENSGGENYMAHLLTSYLLDAEPILLNSFYLHPQQSTQQCWTFPYVPGNRYVNKPVYILTGSNTASAAEEFAYTLQHLKRAVIVGERTVGAANPIERYQITPHFETYIPMGYVTNAITKTNWEGTGVIPDKQVPQEDALKVAHVEAVEKVLEITGENIQSPAYQALRQEAHLLIKGLLTIEE